MKIQARWALRFVEQVSGNQGWRRGLSLRQAMLLMLRTTAHQILQGRERRKRQHCAMQPVPFGNSSGLLYLIA
jgi:hypothetical protein